MKMKSLIGIITIFVLMTLTTIMPTSVADPSIMITDYSIYPEELMPGDKGLLTVIIKNSEMQATTTETESSGTYSYTVVENNGVIIKRIWIKPDFDSNGNKIKSLIGSSGYEDIGNIAPGSIFTISFELIADSNLTEGYYFPNIHIDLKNDINGNYQDVTFPIEVKVSNDTVDLVSNDVPSKISIGGSTDISLSVINKRKNAVDSLTITAGKDNDLDFTPGSKFIGTLDSGNSEEIILSVNPSEMGQKNLSFNLSYKNGDNQHYETLDLPIEIIEVLDVSPILTNMPLTIKKGKSARIGLEVYNAKTETITGVIITPITNATVIPSQYFIGSMDPDDVFSASFDIYSDKLDYGNHTIKFKVSYKQGNEYYETPFISHSFKVVSGEGTSYQSSTNGNSESSGEFGGDMFSTCLIIIPIIIVIIIAYILWRWRKGRKKNE